MSGYIGTQPVPQATQTRQTFVATAAQTSFATAGYSVGYLDVFLNGVKLQDGVDYTATNGSDIVLTVGAAADDTLDVVAYTAFEVANAATAAQGALADTAVQPADLGTAAYTASTDYATAAQGALADTAVQPNDSPTFTDLTLTGGILEQVFVLTGTAPALDPANGTIQTWTLSGASTPTDSLSSGESLTLMIDDGADYTITWPTMQWAGGAAPTLAVTGYSVVAIWKVGAALYGASVGDMA